MRYCTRRGSQANKANADRVAPVVEGLCVLLQEVECRDDTSHIATGHLPCGSDRAAVVPTEVHVESTDHQRHRCIAATRYQKQARVLDVDVVLRVHEDAEAGTGYADREFGMSVKTRRWRESHWMWDFERSGCICLILVAPRLFSSYLLRSSASCFNNLTHLPCLRPAKDNRWIPRIAQAAQLTLYSSTQRNRAR